MSAEGVSDNIEIEKKITLLETDVKVLRGIVDDTVERDLLHEVQTANVSLFEEFEEDIKKLNDKVDNTRELYKLQNVEIGIQKTLFEKKISSLKENINKNTQVQKEINLDLNTGINDLRKPLNDRAVEWLERMILHFPDSKTRTPEETHKKIVSSLPQTSIQTNDSQPERESRVAPQQDFPDPLCQGTSVRAPSPSQQPSSSTTTRQKSQTC